MVAPSASGAPSAAPAPTSGGADDAWWKSAPVVGVQQPSEPQAAAKPAGKDAGLTGNAAAGANRTIFGALGGPVDLMTGALNLGARGINAATGAHVPQIENPVGGSAWLNRQWGNLTGVNPQQVVPQTEGERIAAAAGSGVATVPLFGLGGAGAARAVLPEAVAPAGVAKAAQLGGPSAVAPVAAGAAAGQAAEDVTPEPYKPLANIAANIAGAGVAGLGQAALGAGARAVGRAGIGLKSDIGDVRVTSSQATAAADKLRAAANQTPGGAQQFQQALNANPEEIVPGSQPTTAQVAPLPGIAKLEDTVKSTPGAGPAFMARAEQQNAARVGAIQGLSPSGADPAAVGQAFQDQLKALDAAGGQQIGAAQGAVQRATEGLGGQGTPSDYGSEMRGAIQGALNPVQAQRRKLWDAVDPDGTLAVDASTIGGAAKWLRQGLTPSDTLTSGERGVLDHASQMTGTVPFQELQTLRSNVLSAQRGAAAGEPLSTRGMYRLSSLKEAIDATLAAAVERKAGTDAQAVASGQLAPEQSIMGRLGALSSDQTGMVRGPGVLGNPGSGVRESLPGGNNGPAEAPGLPASAGNANAGNQGGRLGGGNSALAAAPADKLTRPESLVDFLIAKGGVRDQGGDLTAIGADTVHHKAAGRLLNNNGLPLDYAREAAQEAGFLGPNSTTRDLLDGIANEVSGRPVYRPSDQAIGDAWATARREGNLEAEAYRQARSSVETAEMNAGGRSLTPAQLEHATQLTMQGAHPEQAMMDAVRSDEDALLQRNSQMMAFGRPGVDLGAQQAEMPVGRQLAENFDQQAADRYAAARDATLKEKQTFGQGAVGEVLARGANGAPNRVADADVAARFFNGRATEPARVQQFINAVGGAPRAVALARDYLVSDLRKQGIIDTGGTLNAGKFAAWQNRRAETIKLFPGLDKEFASAGAAQQQLDAVQAAHAQALKDYQNGVAKHFLNEEPDRAVQKILNGADRVKNMQQAIGRLQGNQDAIESLKGHVVDYILNKLTTSAKATEANAAAPGGSEMGSLRADAFKDWIRQNNPWLKRLFGGQGMQSLEMVGADLRRQQLRGIATAGSPTAERSAAAAAHGGGHGIGTTALAIIGEKLGELAAGSLGLHGLHGFATEAVTASLPVVGHMLRQRGIATINDLVREAMLNPSVARELMARPRAQTIGPILQRRIAGAMQGISAAQSGSKEQSQ